MRYPVLLYPTLGTSVSVRKYRYWWMVLSGIGGEIERVQDSTGAGPNMFTGTTILYE